MRLFAPIVLPLLLAGCATEVWHPTRTLEQQKRDIAICHEHGTLSTAYEPIGALDKVFECLEAKGYRPGRPPPGHQQAPTG